MKNLFILVLMVISVSIFSTEKVYYLPKAPDKKRFVTSTRNLQNNMKIGTTQVTIDRLIMKDFIDSAVGELDYLESLEILLYQIIKDKNIKVVIDD